MRIGTITILFYRAPSASINKIRQFTWGPLSVSFILQFFKWQRLVAKNWVYTLIPHSAYWNETPCIGLYVLLIFGKVIIPSRYIPTWRISPLRVNGESADKVGYIWDHHTWSHKLRSFVYLVWWCSKFYRIFELHVTEKDKLST